jgi:hypothetical protein
VELDTGRLWTTEEAARFLGVPKATLYQWRYLGTGRRLAGSAATFVIILMTSSRGSGSSRRQHECLRPLAQDQATERRRPMQGTQSGQHQALPDD